MSTFKKYERLCSKRILDKLFLEGKSYLLYPIKLTILEIKFDNPTPAQVVFIVPKKRFKKANKRNLIKRRMREAYLLLKDEFYKNLNIKYLQYAISISYVANDLLPLETLKVQLQMGLKTIEKKK
jgi:ribonuclease P protein component